MKLIIAGSRSFNDYNFLRSKIQKIQTPIDEIVSGGATGADKLGERFANEYSIDLVIFVANWDKYGKQGGIQRNERMAKYGDALVAFWDGKSRGTKNMIDTANKYGLKVWVIKYESKDN